MKKLIVTAAATALAVGAFAQGTIIFGDNGFNSGVALNTAANYYSGGTSVTIEAWYLNATVLPSAVVINSLNGVNSSAAIAGLTTDGFTAGPSSAVVMTSGNSGSFSFGTATLTGLPIHTATAVIAIEASTVIGGITYAGVIDFVNAVGDPLHTPIAGTPAPLNPSWDAITPQNDPGDSAYNLVMTPVPEPATMALAGLGGLSLLLFRRRK